MTMILAGQNVSVTSGQVEPGAVVLSGGTLIIPSGGVTKGTGTRHGITGTSHCDLDKLRARPKAMPPAPYTTVGSHHAHAGHDGANSGNHCAYQRIEP